MLRPGDMSHYFALEGALSLKEIPDGIKLAGKEN